MDAIGMQHTIIKQSPNSSNLKLDYGSYDILET